MIFRYPENEKSGRARLLFDLSGSKKLTRTSAYAARVRTCKSKSRELINQSNAGNL